MAMRLKKITSYTKNLARSFGYGALDAIGEYTPVTKSIIDATKMTYSEAKSSIREMMSESGAGGKVKSFTYDVMQNTMEDLKSGKWYNKEREDGMFGDFDFGDDFNDDWGDADWGDDDATESEAEMANDDKNTREIIGSMGKVSGNISKSFGHASAKSAEYIVKNQRASTTALMNINARGFNQISNILLNMDNTLAGITSLAQPLNTFMHNSFLFYTNTTESLNKINDNLEILVQRTAMFDPKAKKDKSVKGSFGSIFSGGQFDASAYADMVKDNLKEYAELAKGIGSMVSMMSGGLGGGKPTMSLTKMAITLMTKAMIPGMTKESMKQFDKALSNAIGRGFIQMRKSNSFLGSLLADLFAPKTDYSTKIGTKYERGPLPWDGEAKQALVEVIPTYLAKLNAILGGEERYYDYEEGKFKTIRQIRAEKEKLIADAAERASGDFGRELKKDAAGNKELEREIEKYFRKAFDDGKDFDLIAYTTDPKALASKFGISEAAAKHIIERYKAYTAKPDVRGALNHRSNLYGDYVINRELERSDLTNKFRNMGGEHSIFVKLEDGSIVPADEKDLKKKPGGGSAAERIAQKYNGTISTAIGLVIPEYLEAIYGIMNGGESFKYDYNTNRFYNTNANRRKARRGMFGKGGTADSGSAANAESAGNIQTNDDGSSVVTFNGVEYRLDADQTYKYSQLKDDEERKKFLTKSTVDNKINQYKEKMGKNKMITSFKDLFNFPGMIASKGLNAATNWLNSLFWGGNDQNKPGMFKRIGNFFSDRFGGAFDKDARDFRKAARESGLPRGTADILVDKIDGVKIYTAIDKYGNPIGTIDKKVAKAFFEKHHDLYDKVFEKRINGLPLHTVDIVVESIDGENLYQCIDAEGKKLGTVDEETAKKFYNKRGLWASIKHEFRSAVSKAKDYFFGGNIGEYMDAMKNNGNAARGRKVTKSGIAIVSEGEMIIPSEYNPYYHGRTNKAAQIANERRIARRNGFYGMFAEGGDVAGTETMSEEETKTGSKIGLFTKWMGNLFSKGTQAFKEFFHEAMAGTDNEKDKILGKLQDAMKSIGENKGAIGLGAITGAGVSLLTGAVVGPLAGAAIGGAVGLLTKSKAFQDFVFGEGDPDSDEYEEGMLGEFGRVLKKNAPAMKSAGIGGIIGLTGGMFMGSPVLGTIVGSAIGFATKSSKFQDILFGEKDEEGNRMEGGIIPPEVQKRLKKGAPNILTGAALGALVGPFGMVGNILVGSAIGFATTSEKFHTWMYGDENDPENKHGLMGKINDIVHNAGNAINGFLRRMGARATSFMKKLGQKIFNPIAGAAKKFADNYKDRSGFVGGLAKGIDFVSGGIGNGIYKLADAAKNGLRKHNIKKGNLVYDRELGRNMTAQERLEYREMNGMGNTDTYGLVDQYLSGLDDETFAALNQVKGNKHFDRLLAEEMSKKGLGDSKDILKKLGGVEMTQIKALMKDEGKLVKDRIERKKQLQEVDPNYDNIKAIREMLEKQLGGYKKDAQNEYITSQVGEDAENAGSANELDNMSPLARAKAKFRDKLKKHKEKYDFENSSDEDKRHNQASKWAQALNEKEAKEGKSEETEKFTESQWGPIKLKRNTEGEWTEDLTDAPTRNALKQRSTFQNSVAAIPGISSKLSEGFGKLKGFLFGEKDEEGNKKKNGFFDTLKEKLFGEDGYLSGIFHFITGSTFGKTVSSVIRNPITLMSGVIGPALLGAALSGAFDNFGNNLSNYLKGLKGNDTGTKGTISDKSELYGQDANGNTVQAIYDEATGKYYDVNGNELTNVQMLGSNDSVSSQLWENFALKTVSGQSSVVSVVAGNASKTWLKAAAANGSKTAESVLAQGGVGKAIMAGLGKMAANGADDLILNGAVKVCEAVKGPTLSKILPKVIVNNIDDIMTDVSLGLSKAVAKTGTLGVKAAANASKACVYIYIALIVLAAVNGYDDAENILGITEMATPGQRFIAMLIAAANQAIPFIGGLIPNNVLVNLFVAAITKIDPNIDLGGLVEQRNRAHEEVTAYNTVFGTNMSIEEFNTAGLHYNAETGEVTYTDSRAGMFKQYGSRFKTFGANVKNGYNEAGGGFKGVMSGLGNAFSAVGDRYQTAITNAFTQTEGSIMDKADAAYGATIKQMIPGVIGDYLSKYGTIGAYSRKGDLKGIWSVELEKVKMEDIESDTTSGGFAKVMSYIMWGFTQSLLLLPKIRGTLTALPMALFRLIKGEDAANEATTKLENSVTKPFILLTENYKSFLDGVKAGKSIPDLMNDVKEFDDPEQPLGGTMKAVLNAQRIVMLPSVIMGRVGAKIGASFMKTVNAIKSGITGVKRVYDEGMEMLEAGNVDAKQFFNIKNMKEDPDNPLHGVFYAAAGIARIVSGPIFIFKKITGTIKNMIDTVKYATMSAIPDLNADSDILKEQMKAGNVVGLWQANLNENSLNEHNLLAGIMPAINVGQKIAFTIPTLFVGLGKLIAKPFIEYANHAKTVFGNIGTYADTINSFADKGDISGVVNTSLDKDTNVAGEILDPLSPIAGVAGAAIKIGATARAVFTWGFNKVGDILTSAGMEQSLAAYNTSVEALKNAATVKDIWAVKFDDSEAKDSKLNGIFKFGFTFTKIGYTIKQIVSDLMKKIEGITDGVMDTLAESPIVQGAMKVGDWFSNLFNKSSEVAEAAKAEAMAANAGSGSRLAGGDSGFVSQFDPRYQGYTIGGQSFGSRGCGPAVASMAANALGRPMSVSQAVRAANGYETPDGVTIDYFANALGSRGINTQIITGGSSQDMYNRIASGEKMVLLGRDPYNTSKDYSPFGPNNHYVLATGVDRRGNIIVSDPENNGPRAYDPNILRSASYGVSGGRSSLKNSGRRHMARLRAKFNKFRIAGGNTYDTANAQYIWAYFSSQGYSDAAVAGIMGNLYGESGLNPAAIQGGGAGPAAGIAQWENYNTKSGRWKNMANHAASKGVDWTDLQAQLEWINAEMWDSRTTFWGNESYMSKAGASPTTLDAFRNSTNVEQATREFEGAFERAGTPHMDGRIAAAKAYYELYSGKNMSQALASYSAGAAAAASDGVTTSTGLKLGGTIGTVVSDVSSIFSNAFSSFFNGKQTTANDSTSYDNSATTGSVASYGSTGYTGGDVANGFPYYNQKSDPWGPMVYGTHRNATTYREAGCGPTSMAMVMKSYGVTPNTPNTVGDWAVAHGHRTANNGTYAALFPNLAKAAGLQANAVNATQAYTALQNNIPVIGNTGGHYVVFTGVNGQGVVINDPYHIDRTNKIWDKSLLTSSSSLYSIAGPDGVGSIGKFSNSNMASSHGNMKNVIIKNGQPYAVYDDGYTEPMNTGAAKSTSKGSSSSGSSANKNPASRNVMTAAGSGLLSYGDIAAMAGGSSGLLLRSRPGSRGNDGIRHTRLRPIRFSGGASGIVEQTSTILNNVKTSVANAGQAGAISPELVAQLLASITALLEKVADNTAPVSSIYAALKAYLASGGASGTSDNVPKVTPVKNPDAAAMNNDDTVDKNIQSLVGVLAQLAKG